jgi:hypothetical protein
MGRSKPTSTPKRRESPIQFRPGTELGQLVTEFSAANRLSDPEACRCLIALAVTGMDGRYYRLLRQFADGAEGGKDFVRACVHVKTMLDGAAITGGQEVLNEPRRTDLIVRIVRDALEPRGIALDTSGFWFAEEPSSPVQTASRAYGTPSRRTIRRVSDDDAEANTEPEEEEVTSQAPATRARPARVGR